jgi:hypothetical protein
METRLPAPPSEPAAPPAGDESLEMQMRRNAGDLVVRLAPNSTAFVSGGRRANADDMAWQRGAFGFAFSFA